MPLRKAVLVISIGLRAMVPSVAVFAGSGIGEVRAGVELGMIVTDSTPGATGEARLQLRIEGARMRFRAGPKAESLTNGLYPL